VTPVTAKVERPQQGLRARALASLPWFLTLGLLGVSLFAGFGAKVGIYDEGIPLFSSQLIARGFQVHTDFWSSYPPLVYYIDAWAFRLLGLSILVHRLVEAASLLLLIGVAALLLGRHPGWRRATPLILFCLCASVGKAFIMGSWIGFAIAFSAVLLYYWGVAADADRHPSILLLAGTTAGLALLCRVNFGVYAYCAIAGDVLVHSGVLQFGRTPLRRLLRPVAWRLAWFTAPVALLILLYLWPYRADYHEILRQLFYIQSVSMNAYRFIPVPFDPWTCYAVMLPCAWFSLRPLFSEGRAFRTLDWLPTGAAVLMVAVMYAARENPHVVRNLFAAEFFAVVALHWLQFRLQRLEFGLLMFYCLAMQYFLSRADEYHFAPLLTISALLLPFLVANRISGSGDRSRATVNRAFAGLIVTGCVLLSFPHVAPTHDRNAFLAIRLLRSHAWGTSDGSRLCARNSADQPLREVYPDGDEIRAVQYVRERTRDRDAVYVGLADHSYEVSVNNIQAYWLLERAPGVKDYWFEPGFTTNPAVQQEMIGDLRRRNVRWAILQAGLGRINEGGSSGSKLLDEYIAASYREEVRFGNYQILQRR
jgi:hypothetical protein